MASGQFDDGFREQFWELLRWRRDVRQFKADPLPADVLERILNSTQFAPSVGLSESWRYVSVTRPELRKQIRDNFEAASARALAGYSGCAGMNRHVVGNERVLQERRKRLHLGLESCGEHREVLAEA